MRSTPRLILAACLLSHFPPATLLCSAWAEMRASDKRTVRKEDGEMRAMLVDKQSVLGIKAGASVQWFSEISPWACDTGINYARLRMRCPVKAPASTLIASRMAEPKWGPRVWVDMRWLVWPLQPHYTALPFTLTMPSHTPHKSSLRNALLFKLLSTSKAWGE